MRFALALHSDDSVRYSVTVPDLPGCFGAGDSFDEAVEDARQAIDAHCEQLAQDNEDIPAPSLFEDLRGREEFADAVWVVVDVDVSDYMGKAEKINITVPARVLSRIDNYASQHGQSRSGFLTQAALEAIRRVG